MDCYLDASGKPSPDVPGYFVLVCIFYDMNIVGAQSLTEAAVEAFRAYHGLKEIHLREMKFADRQGFFDAIVNLPFRYSAFIARTSKIENPIAASGNQGDALLRVGMTTILQNATSLAYPHILMDRDTSPSVAKQIRRVLNQVLPKGLKALPVVSGIELVDSHNYTSIQLADFVAGVIRLRYFPRGKVSQRLHYQKMHEALTVKGYEGSWNLS